MTDISTATVVFTPAEREYILQELDMADRRFANPEKFAHIRQELGLVG